MGALNRSAVLLFFLAPLLTHAQTRPAFIAQPGRVIAIALPASLLNDREIARQLGSGLTTVFMLAAKPRGAARLDIRFDVWDEVWIVRRVDSDGREERQRITTRDALEKWWSSPLRLLTGDGAKALLDVTLTVLPFSAAESEDARAWISKSAGAAENGRGSPLVAAVIGTTLNARPIRSYRWQAEVQLK
jgi:hypothetical protein